MFGILVISYKVRFNTIILGTHAYIKIRSCAVNFHQKVLEFYFDGREFRMTLFLILFEYAKTYESIRVGASLNVNKISSNTVLSVK